jgi:hypothetical protein
MTVMWIASDLCNRWSHNIQNCLCHSRHASWIEGTTAHIDEQGGSDCIPLHW